MEKTLLAHGLPKETVTAITMLYENMKVKLETDFFDIVAGVLLGDTLALNVFIICLDYTCQKLIDLIKENGFALKKQMISYRNYNRHKLYR